MTILCGTDFSRPASHAVTAAALLAARAKERLHLVHVFDDLANVTVNVEDAKGPLLGRLRDAASQVRALGVDVEEELSIGRPADALAGMTGEQEARLVVVSSLGRRAPARWLLGSVVDRLARISRSPVMIVRDAAPFERWLRDERPLEVMVGVDPSEPSDAALEWIRDLAALGPIRVTIAGIASPIDDPERLGLQAAADFEHVHPDVETSMLRDLRAKASPLASVVDPRFVIRQALGGIDHTLVTLAEERGCDLLVVGSHQRSMLARLWHGSVSRGVVHLAPMSVVSVPAPRALQVRRVPEIRRVLVATDLSASSDRAFALACGLLPKGGTIHLVHVLASALGKTPVGDLLPTSAEELEEHERALADVRARLVEMGGVRNPPRGIAVEIEVVQGTRGDEICHAAERHGVDVICLGKYERSGVLTPSVARAVLRQSRRPVLIAGMHDA